MGQCKVATSLKPSLPNPFTWVAILCCPTDESLVLIKEVKVDIDQRSCISVLLFRLNCQPTYTRNRHRDLVLM